MTDLRRQIAQEISSDYLDLNSAHIDILEGPPTALEFSRLIHISRPVLIRNCGIDIGGSWTDAYLLDMMGDSPFSVAVTPDGRADAITPGPDGKEYFVEPHVEEMTMPQFLKLLSDGQLRAVGDVHYLQSQNGNLYPADSEFLAFRNHVPSHVKWCTEALGRSPDAVNLWIGDGRSVTSIHSDPYENIYTVLRGAKHFTLLPPSDGWALEEEVYPHATYTRHHSGVLTLTPSPDVSTVRWSSVDPTGPGALPSSVIPIKVTIHPGDALYLPAGWWHHVRQSVETTIAVNWWYDMEMRGAHWVFLSFLRRLRQVESAQNPELDEPDRPFANCSRSDSLNSPSTSLGPARHIATLPALVTALVKHAP